MIFDFFDAFFNQLVPVCGILMPIVIVWLVLDSSRKKEKQRNELIKQMIDKGEDPEKLMPVIEQVDKKKKEVEKSPTKHFKSGITLLSVGGGLVVVDFISHWGTLGIGAFIGIIGLGEIAIAWYLRKYSK